MQKKSLFFLCLILLFVACTKQLKDASTEVLTDNTDASTSVVTSLKGVLSGLVNRDFHNVLDSINYYDPQDKLVANRPLTVCNGIVVKAYWKDLQNSYGADINLNNAIDSIIKFAADSASLFGIKIKIRVYAGLYAPDWVKTNIVYGGGTKAIQFQTQDEDNNPITDKLPRYWDAGYIDAYKSFMMKLGQKYDTCQNVLEVTGAIGDITTVEPFFIKCGGVGNLSYNPSNPTWLNAKNLYLAGLTSQNHSYAIRRGIAIMDSAWQFTHRSLCFSPLQELKCNNPNDLNQQYNFTVSNNVDSAESVVDYFVKVNKLKGILGNNGLRDVVTASPGTSDDWLPPTGSVYLLCNYMKGKLFVGTTRKCYLYFQTAQTSLMGDFNNTLDTGLAYKADMIETPYLSSPKIATGEKTIPVLKSYDTQLNAQAQ